MIKRFFLGLAVLTAMNFSVRANIIPTLSSITPAGSNFDWNYSVNVTLDQKVVTGDYFTIYDFGTVISGSVKMPSGWTFSSSLVGTTPSRVNPIDSPTIFNLTWTYVGATTITGASPLGVFTAGTATNLLRTGDFAAEATRSTGPETGTKIDNVGNVSVPIPEMSALTPIFAICALGLLGAANSIFRRRSTI